MNPELRSIADKYWEHYLATNPTSAHLRGDYRFVGAYEQVSREAEDANIAALRTISERAQAIDADELTPDDRTTRETLIYQAHTKASVLETRQAEFGIDPIFGHQERAHSSIPKLRLQTAEHADAMFDKYIAFASVFDQSTERLREGQANGRVNAEFAVDSVVKQLDTWLASPISDDPLLAVPSPDELSATARDEWRDRIETLIADTVRPSLARYRTFIAEQIAPHARPNERAGLWALPEGDLVYSRMIERYTTFPMQAGEIHEIGLHQIASLADEYRQIGPDALGTSNVDEIFAVLREDPAFSHTAGPDVIAVSEETFSRARDAMPDWFGRLPKSDCVVEETQHGAMAYYMSPAEDGSRPGTFFMNTSDPTSWGLAEVEATALHEGIPGHHLQAAIAQELGDAVPDFRRNEFISAYGEGWALYTERLSDEMGLYSGPLQRIGMLQADSMRACRLVVDTGMHALGWSRQDGIDYMAANSPLSMHQIVGEIDRYLSMPGQALSYMVGRLEIDRMRAEAETELGDSFDIKGFHDAVLASGAVPLGTLERLIKEWTTSVAR